MTLVEGTYYLAAGGVVFTDDHVLVLRRPSRGEVRLPKGHVEPGEHVEHAALRETSEEGGLRGLQTLADLGWQRVEFDYQGRHIVRDERYFLFRASERAMQRAPESQFEASWLSWREAESALTFESEREWVRRAYRALVANDHRARPGIGLSTGSMYTYGVARVFEIAARVGFDSIEVLVDDRLDTRQAAHLRKLSQDWSMPISSVHAPFADAVAGWPADEVGRLRSTVALACLLEARIVVAHLPSSVNWLRVEWRGRTRRRWRFPVPRAGQTPYERFLAHELEGIESREGVVVCVENMPTHRIAGMRCSVFRHNTVAELTTYRHVALDTTHLATWGLEPLVAYDRLGARVAHVHVSNYDASSRTGHRAPDDGDLDLRPLLRRLQADAFSGWIVLEGNPVTLEASDPSMCEERLRRALAYLRGALNAKAVLQ